MKLLNIPIEQLVNRAPITQDDLAQISLCRRQPNKLGFGYQLSFVKLFNRFPVQLPFEVVNDILDYVSVQLRIPSKFIQSYTQRRETLAEHQERIRKYLNLARFSEKTIPFVNEFLFLEACRLEQTNALTMKLDDFLREKNILRPSDDTIHRLIGSQRRVAREFIFRKISESLTPDLKKALDALLDTKDKRLSDLYQLKQPPRRPSPGAMLRLTENMERIKQTGVLDIDLLWLNNNFQRSLSHYAKRCNAKRLRELDEDRRYSSLVCFLVQTFKDTLDFVVDMYDKLINKVYNRAQNDIDDQNKSQRKRIKESLMTFKTVAELILDESVKDSGLRRELFEHVGKEALEIQVDEVNTWLNGKHSHVFNLVKERFSYIRQFSPTLLKHVDLLPETKNEVSQPFWEAIETLLKMNRENKRKLPDDAPMGFIPKKLRPMVKVDGTVDKAAWECALLTAIRDEIKSGNVSVKGSKRFGKLDDYFMPEENWNGIRDPFFKRAGLPVNPEEIESYLTNRLNKSFDDFLEYLPNNTFAKIDEEGWHLSTDSADKLESESEEKLEKLKDWLSKNMRVIKLPKLLIEVDNELRISRHFMPASQQDDANPEEVCVVLATIMAHGCNIGPYTMSHLTGISYGKIKHITDWMLSDEGLRGALASVVNAMSNLDITQAWGKGTTSSSDGQRFSMRRKILQQTYSAKFNDFALEFYSFVADNYAPFYSLPIECTDRDAPFVLDGLLYNESDLPLEEHFVDTHGYTENNFAAFAMLGRKFSPRIRGLHKQRIYRIENGKDYGQLAALVDRSDRKIHMEWITSQWDRIGRFYASLECGYATASTAMKRLNNFTGNNHFYRANRELGRVFKTEHILKYMSDKTLRQRTRKGLLKGEQLHALARDLKYGKRGRISNRDLQEQKNSCSCLTLILASIIYWQAKEINRVILECDPEGNGIDLELVAHISPITWDNVVLYGEYVLDRSLVKIS